MGDQRPGRHQGAGLHLRHRRGRLLRQDRQPRAVHPRVRSPRTAAASSSLHAPLWQFVSGVEPATFGITGIFVAAAVVFFAYSGFEAVANLGEETRKPERDMPLGLLGTLAHLHGCSTSACAS